MRRYTLAGFATLGTRQSRVVEVAGESATVDATRTFAAADRIAEVEVLEGALDAQAYLAAAPSYLVPGMQRFGLSRFSCPGTLQSRHMAVEGAEGTIVATRDPLVAAARHGTIEGAKGTIAATRVLVAAARHVAVEGVGGTIAATRVLVTATRHGVIEGAEGALDAQAYLAAAPSYLVPGMQRFGLSRFSCPGTLQSRHGTIEGAKGTIAATRVLVTATRHGVIEGAEGTIVATRDPLVAATRHAEVDVPGGCLAGRSYAVPDVSGGVSVTFEEVYPI